MRNNINNNNNNNQLPHDQVRQHNYCDRPTPKCEVIFYYKHSHVSIISHYRILLYSTFKNKEFSNYTSHRNSHRTLCYSYNKNNYILFTSNKKINSFDNQSRAGIKSGPMCFYLPKLLDRFLLVFSCFHFSSLFQWVRFVGLRSSD